MGKVYERIEPRPARWIDEQPLVVVAPAPLSADGVVDLSPRGLSDEALRDYRARRNERSLDGVPGLSGLPGW